LISACGREHVGGKNENDASEYAGMVGLAGCLALTAIAEDPVITDVVVRQRWPWNWLVDIDYVLTCDATQQVDVAVSAQNGLVPFPLPMDSLTGDLYGVGPGARRIVWDPLKSDCTNAVLTNFSVTLVPATPPLYMIIDLKRKPGEEGQVEYHRCARPGQDGLQRF